MPIHNILQTIEQGANKKILEINKKFEEKTNHLIKEYEEKISKKESEVLDLAKNEIKAQVKKEKFLLNTEDAKIVLEKKWELIHKVYGKALEKLIMMDTKKKEKIFLELLKQCSSEGNIIVAENDASILKKLKGGKHILSKTLPAKGGFVFEGKKERIDNTFENIIVSIQEETEVEVGKILFGQN